MLFCCLPSTEGQPVWPWCGPEPVEILWDAGNCEDPSGWIPCPQNLWGFLQQVSKIPKKILWLNCGGQWGKKTNAKSNQSNCVFCCSVHLNVFGRVYVCVCFHRYKMILKNKIHSDDEKQSCSDLLTLHDKAKKEWQLGKTKVEHTHTHTHAQTCFCHLGVT